MEKTNIMLKMAFIVLAIFNSFANANANANSDVDVSLKSFKDFYSYYNKIIKNNSIGYENILFVFDIDDTLLKSDQYLGSDTWFNREVSSSLKKYCLFNVAIPKLARYIKYSPVEESTVSVFNAINIHFSAIALTSRSPDIRLETERALSSNNLIFKNQIFNGEDHYFFDDKKTYYNGIFMTTGFDKGKALIMLLGDDIEKYQYIFFVDDGKKNIDAMKSALKSRKYFPKLFTFHYTYVSDHADKLYPALDIENSEKKWKDFIEVYGNSSEKSYCL